MTRGERGKCKYDDDMGGRTNNKSDIDFGWGMKKMAKIHFFIYEPILYMLQMGEGGGSHVSLNWMIQFVNRPLLVSINFEMLSVAYLISFFLKVMSSNIVHKVLLAV